MALRKLSAPGRSGLAIVVAAAASALVGCSSLRSSTDIANLSPNRLYSDAKEEMAAGSWDKAVPLLERLEGRAAGTPLAQQAQLEKAYAQYKQGEQAQALATLDRFLRIHPASPAADYALYLKGLVNFNDRLGLLSFLSRMDLSERDQKAAKESYEAFAELITKFPDSKYAGDARARMTYIVNALARYEVHVARYYYSRGAYVAAINRAQAAITDYRDVPAQEEALHILQSSYEALGMTQLATDAKRVLETSYPQSAYLGRAPAAPASRPWWRFW